MKETRMSGTNPKLTLAQRKPQQHRVRLWEPRFDGLSAEAWSYINPKSREVYVRLLGPKGHIVTARLVVPR